MSTTSGGLPLMAQTQSSRYLTYNELAWAVDVLQRGVIDRDLTAPPGSPSEGDAYIVASGGTGAWSGQDDSIAFYFGGVWNFLEPDLAQGNGVYVQDEGVRVQWNAQISPASYEVIAAGGDVTAASNLTANALLRGDDGAKGVQTSGILVTDDDEISGYAANVKRVTASSYTLLAADSGMILELSDGTGVALDLPNDLPKGWNATVVQWGAGAVTFDPEAGGTLVNRQSHTESAGQGAFCSIYVSSNSGTDAAWVLGGDTA